MSSISAVGRSTTSLLVTSYDPMDTNEDGVVSMAELTTGLAANTDEEAASSEKPTDSAADTLTDQVASAMLDVQATDASETSASSIQDALKAYLAAGQPE